MTVQHAAPQGRGLLCCPKIMICPLCHRTSDDPQQTFCVEDGTLLIDAPPIQKSEPQPTTADGMVIAGRYTIRGLLGTGGLARVFLADDAKSGGQVALKVLHAEMTPSHAVRDRFEREIEIASRIGHPNIARILDSGEGPERVPFLVIERLEGESLGAILARVGRVSEDFALAVAKRVASALAAAHADGVVHRDVKPDNLFLVRDGSIVKVLDFGMAKLVEGKYTAVGVAVGTAAYMPPEQAMADPVDGRADVYALGITLFRMLAGRLPFAVRDPGKLIAHQLFVPLPSPTEAIPGLDPRIARVIVAATRKRPDNRYPSMRVMLEDIGRIAGEREGDLSAPALRFEPDVYEPENPIARTAAKRLRAVLP